MKEADFIALSKCSRPGAGRPARYLKNILVPYDFSSGSNCALDFAVRWINTVGGQLILIHVLSRDHGVFHWVVSSAEGNYLPRSRIAATRQKLKSAIGSLGSPAEDQAPDTMLGGTAYQAICHAAKVLHVDLIVMSNRNARRSPGTIDDIERVTQHAPCPVLSLPRTSSHAQAP